MADDNWYTQEQTPPPAVKTGRRWWLLGCLVPLPVLICGGCFAGIVYTIFGILRSSDPYIDSLRQAQASPELMAEIGEPIEPGWIITGEVNLNNDDGHANLSYSVSGPLGSADINVVGTKNAGTWTYSQMQARVTKTGTVVDLRPVP
jgi:hypothetical protein